MLILKDRWLYAGSPSTDKGVVRGVLSVVWSTYWHVWRGPVYRWCNRVTQLCRTESCQPGWRGQIIFLPSYSFRKVNYAVGKVIRALGRAHLPPTKCFDGSLVQWIKPPHLAAEANTFTSITSEFPDVKFRVAALIRYRRKQSGSGIRTIIRIGLKR